MVLHLSCHKKERSSPFPHDFTVALAGNANVGKSIAGYEKVLVKRGGRWETVKIGELVDSILSSLSPVKIGETECAAPKDLYVLSLNLDTLKVEERKVAYVLRHRERRKLLLLKTSSNRAITATQDHNFIVLRDGKPAIVDAKRLLIGDIVPAMEGMSHLALVDLNDLRTPQSRLKVSCKPASDSIAWEKVVKVTKIDGEKDLVYDLSVEGCENFMLANGLFIHNSVIFNQLTGLNQIIGNWPGKTVEKAEGTLRFKDYRIRILDLPGIYSLSAFSIEKIVARDYITTEKPDVVINVVDASALERNLYLTLQLLELKAPMVVALNQIDFALKKGLRIDHVKLSRLLGVPVVPTVATTGSGINELLSKVVQVFEGNIRIEPLEVVYSKEIEASIKKLESFIASYLPDLASRYPPRWLAIKLLEKDEDIERKIKDFKEGEKVLSLAGALVESLEQSHGKPSPVLIASERYGLISEVVKSSVKIVAPPKISLGEKLDEVTGHKAFGYPILALVFGAMLAIVFGAGNYLVEILESFFGGFLTPLLEGFLSSLLPDLFVKLISEGAISGVVASVTIVLPYVVPFYLILSVLEDSGYLPRAAFLLDNPMHKLGLHGKAAICLLLGYGCNVPACIGCRIMETERERFLGGFLTVLVPCAARNVVILGLVGRYLGIPAALSLYAFNMLLIFLLGRVGHKVLPGEPIGLIMEVPPYKMPSLKTILKKTWARTKDFIYIAFPIIVGGSIILEGLLIFGLTGLFAGFMKPLVSDWLGLPPLAGIPLIFGILRKELTIILLAELFGTSNFGEILTPAQMVTFSLVTMIYVPCLATIAALWHEFGFKKAFLTSIVDVLLALFLSGLTFRVLSWLTL